MRVLIRTCRAIGAVATATTMIAPASAAVKYLDPAATGLNDGSSWSNAYTSMDTALMGMGVGDELWIRGGTYVPTSPAGRAATFNVTKNGSLNGGFDGTEALLEDRDIAANPTIFSGDLSSNDTTNFGNRGDNSYHVVIVADFDGFIELNGLTVRGGNADGSAADDKVGAGILVADPDSSSEVRLVIKLARVEDNSASRTGGGVDGADTGPVGVELRDTAICQNRATGDRTGTGHGGAGMHVGFLKATRSRFEANVAEQSSGGGLLITGPLTNL